MTRNRAAAPTPGRVRRVVQRLSPGGLRKPVDTLRELPAKIAEWYIRPILLEGRIEHLTGPEQVEYAEDELLAICVVRNGAIHVRSFLEHHFRIGVKHIVLLDNGSTDETVALAESFDHVTVLRTECPYRKYENVMKRYLARRFSRNRWNLCVDIDERFDYPYSDRLNLDSFLRYLNERRFSALVTQMLDLFPDASLGELAEMRGLAVDAAELYYDTSAIRKSLYPWGVLSNPAVRMHWGGVRNVWFGTEPGLTKAALVFVDDAVELFVDWHHVRNVRIADLTGVILHHPFAGAFGARVSDAATTGRYGPSATSEYRQYQEGLFRSPGKALRGEAARRMTDVNALLDEGFVVVSESYRRWVATHASATGQQERGSGEEGSRRV